jgi:hypothetical protein
MRMLTNLRLADLRLSTVQQRSTGQNLPSDLYVYIDWSEESLNNGNITRFMDLDEAHT